ncbi:hypothetical protein NC652_019754 [Populus alba x Populus x berolinensis]|nr:hypothetical protein NC652_019754 [Populus alba x Populus x berolinensis]
MAKKNVVAARKNATFSSTLDAVGIFFPINCETNREAKIAAIANEIEMMGSVFLNSVSKSGFASRTLFRCEEGRGCDDCDSRSSILGGEARSIDGRRDVMRCKSWSRNSATQREK